MRYYYPPFKTTDSVERNTWDYQAEKGYVHFLSPANPCLKPLMTPEDLAAQLEKDGLPNAKINIRLLCCFGAGRHTLNPNFADWRNETGDDGTIGHRLAVALGKKGIDQAAVAGYQGPTNTQKGPPRLRVFGDTAGTGQDPNTKLGKSNLLVYNSVRTNPAKLPVLKDAESVLKAHESGLKEVIAPKLFIVWYDTKGNPTMKRNDRPDDDKSKVRPKIDENQPLRHLKDGDLLLIMAHGASTGWLQRSPGFDMEKLTDASHVNVEERVAGKPSNVVWKIPPGKGNLFGTPLRDLGTKEEFSKSSSRAPKV